MNNPKIIALQEIKKMKYYEKKVRSKFIKVFNIEKKNMQTCIVARLTEAVCLEVALTITDGKTDISLPKEQNSRQKL